MPDAIQIDVDVSAVEATLGAVVSPRTVSTILQAAGEEARKAAIEHFRAREQEPEKTEGFPKFGESWGKRGFWAGTKGNSVAEQVLPPVFDSAALSVSIAIDSPALAHKADTNPPPILPKGGKKYLAIPANARAAAWAGMPRDFDPGGGQVFAYSLTPEGRWMPALVAQVHHLRRVTRGKRKGAYAKAAPDKGTSGQGAPQYWLVRKVQTLHDPNALPNAEAIQTRANARAASVLEGIISRSGATP